jgi:hypothetical protein
VRNHIFDICQKNKSNPSLIIIKTTPKSISQFKQEFIDDKQKYRGTNFRGVSRNGRCNWQILTMLDGDKVYLGTVDNLLKAAILYDIFSIQMKGTKAKTNFLYTIKEVTTILGLPNINKIKETCNDLQKAFRLKETTSK